MVACPVEIESSIWLNDRVGRRATVYRLDHAPPGFGAAGETAPGNRTGLVDQRDDGLVREPLDPGLPVIDVGEVAGEWCAAGFGAVAQSPPMQVSQRLGQSRLVMPDRQVPLESRDGIFDPGRHR